MARRKHPRPAAASAVAVRGAAPRPPAFERWRPWLLAAAVALFVARPLLPIEGRPLVEYGDGMPFVMAWCLLAVATAAGLAFHRGAGLRFGVADAAVLGLIAWQAASGVVAVGRGAPRPAINMLWEWAGLGLAFFLIRQLVRHEREARAIVAVMAALAVGHAAFGIYQNLHSIPESQRLYRADPDSALRAAGMWFPEGSPERRQFEDRLLTNAQPFSTFSLTNSLAGYLVPWLTLTLGMIAAAPRQERLRDWTAAWAATAALLVAACVLLTESRSAAIGMFVGAEGVCLLQVRRTVGTARRAWLAAAAAILLVAGGGALAIGLLRPDVAELALKSAAYRLEYWQASAGMIGDYPLFGVGPGNFQQVYTQYKLPQSLEEVLDPHNLLIEVWATAGTPAAVMLVSALGWFAWRAARATLAENGAHSPAGAPPADACLPIQLAGLAGIVLAWVLGNVATTGPMTEGLSVILPGAALGLFLVYPWLRAGRLDPCLLVVAAAALVVNLLAAGGIGFPGVAGSLWLVMALGLALADRDRPPHALRPAVAAGLTVLLALIAAACYGTAFRPVLRCQAALLAAAAEPRRAAEHLSEASRRDPWASDPWTRQAALAMAIWRDGESAEPPAAFEHAAEMSLRLNPQSSASWLRVGEWYAEIHARTADPRHAGAAVDKMNRAKDLYPTNPYQWARLAIALDAAGDGAAARQAKAEALRLHEATPHRDKRLEGELLARLERIK
jgi:O-antigen ligase